MAAVNTVSFKIDNLKGFTEATKLAPKLVLASLKREFRREGDKLKTEFRKSHLFGLLVLTCRGGLWGSR
ncbi:MAG: hypothetical protein H0X47_09175 [Nitrospirales bacterium]|nr:hypothetical protein [Nitrospirales bacterium]